VTAIEGGGGGATIRVRVSSSLAGLSTVWIVAANVVWYGAKVFLRSRGCRVSWFWNHFADIGNLWTMSRSANDPRDRFMARAWLASLVVALTTALLSILLTVADTRLR
jgi:hypothetical protein